MANGSQVYLKIFVFSVKILGCYVSSVGGYGSVLWPKVPTFPITYAMQVLAGSNFYDRILSKNNAFLTFSANKCMAVVDV